MRTKLIVSLVSSICFLLSASSTQAETKVGKTHLSGVGLGGQVFDYGVSGKHFVDEQNAFIGTIGVSHGLSVEVGFLKTLATPYDGEDGALTISVGGAGSLLYFDSAAKSKTVLAARGILEFAYRLNSAPIEITTSLGPALATGGGLAAINFAGGGGAIRWFF